MVLIMNAIDKSANVICRRNVYFLSKREYNLLDQLRLNKTRRVLAAR